MKDVERWAKRGRWLVDKLSERLTPDGRCVLELVDVPIWINEGASFKDYCDAVDAAIEKDEQEPWL